LTSSPRLKPGDSLDWRTTSGTEVILRTIDIPMMLGTTVGARPHSYQQVTQSTRTRPLETDRASHRAAHFTDWDADSSKPDGFVVQLLSAHAPASIIGRFGEARLGELHAGHIPDGNEPGTSGNGGGDLMRPVFPGVRDSGVQRLDALAFPRPLGQSQLGFIGPRQVLSAVDDAIGAGDLLTESQINTELRLSQFRSVWPRRTAG
jgi:hypothetical protein